jgi:hypothetical protein
VLGMVEEKDISWLISEDVLISILLLIVNSTIAFRCRSIEIRFN